MTASRETSQATPAAPARPHPRRRRALLLSLLGALVAVLALGVWGAIETARVRSSLTASAGHLAELQRAADKGDFDRARALLPAVQQDAADAERAARALPLRVAGRLPPLHADVRAVTTMAATVHGLSSEALPPLVDALAVVDPDTLLDDRGRVDVEAIARVAPDVRAADARVETAQRDVAAIRTHGLHGPVADAATRLDDALTHVRVRTRTAARAVTVLPPMLGADGPRRYLVMVQNNAEVRSTGGIPGAVVLVEADHGAITVKEQRTAGTLDPPGNQPVTQLTTEEMTLFGTQPAAYEQDVNLIPDFPRSAQLLSAMWQRATGEAPDGVLSVDPVALGRVLRATGPVKLADGRRLTAADAPRELLHDVYLRIDDPVEQDAYFASTTRAVLDHLIAPGTPKSGVPAALAAAARDGRVMVWSAHDVEQAQLTGTVLSGELVGHQGASPVVGVYLDDGSGAKMSWFLDSSVTLRRDGADLVATLELENTAPAGGKGLPRYMTGSMLPPGEVRTNYDFYAPTGAAVTSVTVDGTPTQVFRATYLGLDVAEWAVQLKPGQSVKVEARISTGVSHPGAPRLRVTPMARGQHIRVILPVTTD